MKEANDNMFSIWLIPDEKDENELSKIVKNLAYRYNSPIFIPHLTLLGNVVISFDDLKSAVDEVFENKKPFTIKEAKLNQSEQFFKTVFIEFELDENLKKFFELLSIKTDKIDIETFKPHISLIYKIMSKEEKLKIIENLDVKNEFTIGRVFISAPKEGDADFMDVRNWRVLYKKSLNS